MNGFFEAIPPTVTVDGNGDKQNIGKKFLTPLATTQIIQLNLTKATRENVKLELVAYERSDHRCYNIYSTVE